MVVETVVGIATNAAAKKAIEKTSGGLVDKLAFKFAKGKYDELMLVLNKGLPIYLEANYAKCETLKTLLNRSSPVDLDDCFVARNFKMKKQIHTAEELLNEINSEARKVVITGLAGSGKSVFLKHSFRKVIEKGHTYYPIFFELRSLNRVKGKKGFLLSEIYSSIKACAQEFTRAQFNFGLKSGAFYLILDGFDEVAQKIRDQVAEDIKEISRNFFKCALVVSSRPSEDFLSWEGFYEAKLQPFSHEQAVEYIEKLQFDTEKKNDFIHDLKNDLYQKNKEFLSNPLLAAMMLLTYDSFGEIPERRHIFYGKCFEVLAREHDASKGRYKRELYSCLTMEQLEKVFMYFCVFSYADRSISFNQKQIEEYIEQALDACGFEAEIDHIIQDFRESISILELDGLSYEFAHRSFQEYFYAKFVVTDRKMSLDDKIGHLVRDFRADDTINMIAEMDRVYFEDEYLYPQAVALNEKISEVDARKKPATVLRKFYASIRVLSHQSETKKNKGLGLLYRLDGNAYAYTNNFIFQQAYRKYGDEIDKHLKKTTGEHKLDKDMAADILEQKYGGKIKVHHANNEKLIAIGQDVQALRMQVAISILCKNLKSLQQKRESGLGTLLRKSLTSRLQ